MNCVHVQFDFIYVFCRLMVFFSLQAIRVRVNLGDRAFLYADGTAHREAANILEDVESIESVLAHFAVLPFNIAASETESVEKSSSEGTKVTVVELSHIGPPTRKLKPPIATVGEYVC